MMRVVGIDPGTTRIGYALIAFAHGKTELIRAETIALAGRMPQAERLQAIASALDERLARDRVDRAALERIYFSKNVKTAIAVAEARGVILLTLSRRVRSIGEYTPLEVKSRVTGYGKSDKANVRKMIRLIFPHSPLPSGPGADDAIDAIAIALTACR